MVFTPTYYGVSSDVRGLADVAHARRAFRRITGRALEALLPNHDGSESAKDSAEN
jgi:hypothetical protein